MSAASANLGIRDIDLHIEEITGGDMTLDVVVDIFNKVNSGGTKLSKGDLALAKICADWPQARTEMKVQLGKWRQAGYDFSLDWLLRSVNTVLTGEAKFLHLHGKTAPEVQDALKRASRHIDTALNLISGRLGLDHDRVLSGRGAVSVMARYLDQRTGPMDQKERDKLLFWYVQAGMWGRFSGSTESFIDADLEALDAGGLDRMLDILRLWHGGLRVEPGHFTGWNLGARFYPVLYLLTRMAEAKDWGNGLPLKAGMLGKLSQLEVHHIFPKARLYEAGYGRAEVNAIANFCFLTKRANLDILDDRPEAYFPAIEERHPGALSSQWVPMDPQLWRIENYADFPPRAASCWPRRRMICWLACFTAKPNGGSPPRRPFTRLRPLSADQQTPTKRQPCRRCNNGSSIRVCRQESLVTRLWRRNLENKRPFLTSPGRMACGRN
jgi:hypothetical protein